MEEEKKMWDRLLNDRSTPSRDWRIPADQIYLQVREGVAKKSGQWTCHTLAASASSRNWEQSEKKHQRSHHRSGHLLNHVGGSFAQLSNLRVLLPMQKFLNLNMDDFCIAAADIGGYEMNMSYATRKRTLNASPSSCPKHPCSNYSLLSSFRVVVFPWLGISTLEP